MFPAQTTQTEPEEFLRCGGLNQSSPADGKYPNADSKADASLAGEVDRALWNDGILRALDYHSIEIHVKRGIVSLYGHVVSVTNSHKAEKAIKVVDGIVSIRNHLIADDTLVAEVAAALGTLECTYHCKFFTGVSHGVVLLSGSAPDAETRLLAERCAASNPNVRGVINSVQVLGSALVLLDQPFLQPSIGVEIFFLDGISGRVRQVIINLDNRRVVAMTIQGRFVDLRQELKSLNNAGARPPERILVIPMQAVRHLTRSSGFLNIHISEITGNMDFVAAHFITPQQEWKPPFPYCPGDVLFLVDQQHEENQIALEFPVEGIAIKPNDEVLRDQLLSNDSLGG